MPNWLNVRPSWQLDDPTTEFRKSFEAAQEVRLAPLKYQQAQNAIAEQNLAIAHQGIENQRQSMLLNLDAATMPDKINDIKIQGQILGMKVNSARTEQAAWERDAPKIADWMALPWEQRVKAPAPRVESTKAIETVTAQEKADSTNALQKQAHDASVANNRLATEKGKQIEKFMKDVADTGFDGGQLSEIEKTFRNGEPTPESYMKFSELKAAKEKAKAEEKAKKAAEPYTIDSLPGFVFIRQPSGTALIVKRPDKELPAASRVSVMTKIAHLEGKLKDSLIDDNTKEGIRDEINGLKAIITNTAKPATTSSPTDGMPKVSSKDDWNKLPSGTDYVGTDGRIYRKR